MNCESMAFNGHHLKVVAMEKAVPKWHDYNWEEVLAGRATAKRYYLRSGLAPRMVFNFDLNHF